MGGPRPRAPLQAGEGARPARAELGSSPWICSASPHTPQIPRVRLPTTISHSTSAAAEKRQCSAPHKLIAQEDAENAHPSGPWGDEIAWEHQ